MKGYKMSEQKIKFNSFSNERFRKPIYNEPMLTVLDSKENDGEEWAVYFGPESLGSKKILEKGSKIPESMARILFPNISGRYRK